MRWISNKFPKSRQVLFFSSLDAQTIYKWKDEKGQWHFSQTPPAGAIKQPTGVEIKLPQTAPATDATRATPHQRQIHIAIKDADLKMEQDGLLVFGTILNRGPILEKGVEVRVQLGGEDGWVISEATSETSPRHLRPGETGAFVFKINSAKAASVAILTRDDEKKLEISEDLRRQMAEIRPPAPTGKPRVSVIASNLYYGGDSSTYISGKVYNAGPTIARNVKISFAIKREDGFVIERGTAAVDPSDLKPGGEGIFQKRVMLLTDPRGHSWFTEVEHSE